MPVLSLKKALTPFGRRLALTLFTAELALTGLHVITQQPAILPFWRRLFGLDTEFGLGSTFSSALLLATGLAALVIGLAAELPRLWQRLYWWLLAAVFIYLALDEYFVIHENIIAPKVGPTIHWPYLFGIAGMVLVAITIAAYWFGFRKESGLFALLLGGLALMAAGGLVIEALNFLYFCVPKGADLGLCNRVSYAEELIEMVGVTIVLAGFVSHAQTRLSGAGWRLAKRLAAGGSALWCALLIGNIWLLPALEARLVAQPVQAEYADGTLSLVGYRVSRNVVAPGDKLTLKLYWRANQHLPKDYFLSAHLLTRPDANSVAQGDRPLGGWLGWQTTSWLPGVVMRDVVRIELPEDSPTPGSYWLTVRVWWPTKLHRKGVIIRPDEIVGVPITRTDRQLLGEDTIVLSSLPVLSESAPPQPQTQADYHFADGFSLAGYSLPASGVLGGQLTLEFWWQTESDVDSELNQFVHLFHSNGEDYFVHDQPPFGGSFPTSDWPARMLVRDALNIPLPDDLPPGEYSVYTGMYIQETGERRPVTDGDGQPVQDNSIYLGTVTLER